VARCSAVEAAVAAVPTSTPLNYILAAGLAALPADLAAHHGLPAPASADNSTPRSKQQDRSTYLSSTAEGLLVQALTALWAADDSSNCVHDASSAPSAAPHAAGDNNGTASTTAPRESKEGDVGVLSLPAKLPPPAVVAAVQQVPAPTPELAPLTQSHPKETALLQASQGSSSWVCRHKYTYIAVVSSMSVTFTVSPLRRPTCCRYGTSVRGCDSEQQVHVRVLGAACWSMSS
jgi:hypothetical protein